MTMNKCDYCSHALANSTFIVCAECTDVNLCLECFSSGVEPRGHRNTHGYRVSGNVRVTVFSADWAAAEELLLLDAIEHHGLGNWDDVAQHVQNKTGEQCKQHYFKHYIDNRPQPQADAAASQAAAPQQLQKQQPGTGAKTGRNQGKRQRRGRMETVTCLGPEYAGYYPGREDFEVEYDNDAELLVKDIVFYDDDTPLDRELKATILDIYNTRLDRREKRKSLCLNYDLVQPVEPRGLSAEAMALREQLKPFAKYHSADDHARLLAAMHSEQETAARLADLEEAHRRGITSLAEAETVLQTLRHARATDKEAAAPTDYRKTAAARRSSVDKLSGRGGARLLSSEEDSLRVTLQLTAEQYLELKTRLITAAAACPHPGGLTRAEIERHTNVSDKRKGVKLFAFLSQQGWVGTAEPLDT